MTSPQQQRVLTWRALCIFAISAPINCYFLIQMELVRYTFPTWVVPLSNVIFILTAVMLINGIIRLLKSNFALEQGEIALISVCDAQLRHNPGWMRCLSSDPICPWT